VSVAIVATTVLTAVVCYFASTASRAGDKTSARAERLAVQALAEAVRAREEANRAYEERFGYAFLIRAAGRSAEEMLARLRDRLGNDDATERQNVADELRQIALLRLDNILGVSEQAAQT